jgi:DNA-directed RNA polymerase subunit RPC12/RpoP
MNSILPATLEAKRLAIAKAHNLVLVCLIFGTFGALILVALISPKNNYPVLYSGLFLVGFLSICGVFRIFKYDQKLCIEQGYMCPHCRKPLYEPRATTYLTGLCPKCGKNILLTANAHTL